MAAASKENHHQHHHHISSPQLRRNLSSQRPPLSPLHPNFAPPTPSSRRFPPHKPPFPPLRDHPPHKPFPPRSPSSAPPPVPPRTPLPSRKILRDAPPESVSRSRALPSKDRLSSFAPPPPRSNASAFPPYRPKRQTQLFPVFQPQDAFCIDNTMSARAGSSAESGDGSLKAEGESEIPAKPCRRKWRRLARESVLRSLRGEGNGDERKPDAKPSVVSAETSSNSVKDNPDPIMRHGPASVGVPSSSANANTGRPLKKGNSIASSMPSSGDGDGKLRKPKPNPSSISAAMDQKHRHCTHKKGLRRNGPAISGSSTRKDVVKNGPINSRGICAATEKNSIDKTVQFQPPLDPIVEEITGAHKMGGAVSPPASNVASLIEDAAETIQLVSPDGLQISVASKEAMAVLQTSEVLEEGDVRNVTGSAIVPNDAHGYSILTQTPPCDKTSILADTKLTPPMQTTQSPDFIKRDGMRTVLPIDAVCYAAPSGMVKDKRRCKPRGVLTVDGFHETLSSADSGFHISVQKMSSPAVASVEWMREKKETHDGKGEPFPDFESNSMDLCRMSFPRLSPSPFPPQIQPEIDIEHESELRISPVPIASLRDAEIDNEASRKISTLKGIGTFCEPGVVVKAPVTAVQPNDKVCSSFKAKEEHVMQASVSVSGYDWEASSLQGTLSSCHTDLGSCNPRRSIVFGEDEGSQGIATKGAERRSPNLVNNILFEDGVDTSTEPSITFSDDDENGEYVEIEEGAVEASERSPPFEYAVMRSLRSKEFADERKCAPEEVLVSISGPSDSSLSLHDGSLSTVKMDSYLSSQDPVFRGTEMGSSLNPKDHQLRASKMDSSQSSQDLESDLEYIVQSVESTKGMPLVCIQQGNDALQRMDKRALDIVAELHNPNADISSRIAMARFLCNITVTYLDDIASCLGKGNSTDISNNMLRNEISEFTGCMKTFEQSSMLAGKEKMAECCSLLRELALETRENTSGCRLLGSPME